MSLRLFCLSFSCLLALSGCQTPDLIKARQKPKPAELLSALQHLENQQYQAAETEFQFALNAGNELVSQQALAGLSLLHLQNQDITAATNALDEFYQRALSKPQGDTSLKLLRLSLKLSLENTLRLTMESQSRKAAEAMQQQLRNEALALQRALEKLRQLSLQ